MRVCDKRSDGSPIRWLLQNSLLVSLHSGGKWYTLSNDNRYGSQYNT